MRAKFDAGPVGWGRFQRLLIILVRCQDADGDVTGIACRDGSFNLLRLEISVRMAPPRTRHTRQDHADYQRKQDILSEKHLVDPFHAMDIARCLPQSTIPQVYV